MVLFPEEEIAAAQTGGSEADAVRIAGSTVFTMRGDINGVRSVWRQPAQHKVVPRYSRKTDQRGVNV